MRKFVTGNSAIGLRVGNITAVAADTQLNYGGLIKSTSNRIIRFDNTLIAFSGELSDIQHVEKYIFMEKQRMDEDFLDSNSYFMMLKTYFYYMRSEMTPLNLSCIIAGKNFLKVINHLGGFYESDVVAIGVASYLALPKLRSDDNTDLYAKIIESMKMMFRKHAGSSNVIQIAFIFDDGRVEMKEESLQVDWSHGKLEGEECFNI